MSKNPAFVPLTLVVTLGLLAGACAPQPGGDAAPETASDVVLLPVADDPTVSFSVWFKVGSQDDPEGREGLAALTARLMAEGATAHRSYAEILDLLYPMAASYEVRVDVEQVTFSGRAHRDSAGIDSQ